MVAKLQNLRRQNRLRGLALPEGRDAAVAVRRTRDPDALARGQGRHRQGPQDRHGRRRRRGDRYPGTVGLGDGQGAAVDGAHRAGGEASCPGRRWSIPRPYPPPGRCHPGGCRPTAPVDDLVTVVEEFVLTVRGLPDAVVRLSVAPLMEAMVPPVPGPPPPRKPGPPGPPAPSPVVVEVVSPRITRKAPRPRTAAVMPATTSARLGWLAAPGPDGASGFQSP